MNSSSKYSPAIDFLRIISIVSVIIIHVTTKSLELAQYNLSGHLITLYFNQALRFAVPIFFLVSAFVLELNYSSNFSYIDYLKKRFSRLFLPYFLWSLIYYYFIYPHNTESFITCLLTGDASYQLYFIPALFIFYLIFPLIHHYIKIFSSKNILITLSLFQIILLSLDYYFHLFNFYYPIRVFFLNFEVFIIGVLFSRYKDDVQKFIEKYLKLLIILTSVLSILIFLEALFLYTKTQNYLFFYSQWRPSIFIYSLVSATLFYYLFNRLKFNSLIIAKIASRSFFVYFVHVIYLEIITKYFQNTLFFPPVIPIITTLILSYLSAIIVSKIPHLSRFSS